MPRDVLHTRLCESYGCEYPIAGLSTERQVAAAISNAGGIGVYAPLPDHDADRLREDVRWLKSQVGGHPYGVDLVIPASYVGGTREELESRLPQAHRDFVRALQQEHGIPDPKTTSGGWSDRVNLLERVHAKLEVVLEEEVPIFVAGLGSPAIMIDRAHAQGMKVWALIGQTRQALRAIEDGVDLVVATGADAGAHVGRIGTFSLVAEVVDAAGGVPVLAAGGVASGRQLLAALAMGADGVWMGTIWQATEESNVDPYLKQQILDASAEQVVQTRARTGKPFNQIRNAYSDAWRAEDAPEPLEMPLQQGLVGPLLQAIDDWHIEDFMSVPGGSGRRRDPRGAPRTPRHGGAGGRGARSARRADFRALT